jgi:molybdenum-dependent DNA-binding transcriptional regulator ModE
VRPRKQHDDGQCTYQFKRFCEANDPAVVPALKAIEATGSFKDAARFMGVPKGEFTRFRTRLQTLANCFKEGLPVPKQRRP